MPLTERNQIASEAEYLEMERSAPHRSEFIDGEIFAMAGGSPEHSLIGANLIRELGNRLEGKPCVAYNSDLKVKVGSGGLISYPDVTVICGEPVLDQGSEDVVLNPTLIGEVLSDSTEAFDRGRKFQRYALIPSLKEYLLVDQHQPLIEHLVRQNDGSWNWSKVEGLDRSVELPSIAISLPLASVYARVKFRPFKIAR